MLEYIENPKNTVSILDKYYNLLTQTGYVKRATVMRLLLYLFLLDFVDVLHYYFDEKDYEQVNCLLVKLFTGAGCLLPYHVFRKFNTKVGMPGDQSSMSGPRVTEKNRDVRISEDGTIRYKA